MKVLCITNEPEYFFELTMDKWYDVISIADSYYIICSDMGYNTNFHKEKFLTLQQLRKQKIEKLNAIVQKI